jgi:hypothetical protein
MAEIIDFESSSVVCSGPHHASIELRQSFDVQLGPELPSVCTWVAVVAQVLGWQHHSHSWLCPSCVAGRDPKQAYY